MKIENVNVYGIDNAIRVAKFPMAIKTETLDSHITSGIKGLSRSDTGAGHDNFLNGIIVQFDMTFSNKMSVELERYHFIDFISSQSTIHKLSKMDIDKCCNEYVTEIAKNNLKNLVDNYNKVEDKNSDKAKELYLKCLYNTPSGFELTAGFTTNYRQLKTIYFQRKNHKLHEWRTLCKWMESLPLFKELILG